MIIDFHTHTFPDALAPRAVASLAENSGLVPVNGGTVAELITLMDKRGVDRSVVFSIATKPTQEHTINGCAIKLLENERLIPFGSVYPGSETWKEELARLKMGGIRGIKLHPEYQNFSFDCDNAQMIYDECGKLGLIVQFHAGNDIAFPPPSHSDPDVVASIVKNFPNTRFVAAHFGGWALWDEVYRRLCGIENLYFDTSFCNTATKIDKDLARSIISKHGYERILLGSDMPWEDPCDSMKLIEELGLAHDVKEAIFGGNAKRMLGI